MSYERELVTLALGNYSTLVAAQWANGTTMYDVSKSTLYCERRVDSVFGGETTQQRTGAIARVPRIVLLDAPHATRLKCTRRVVCSDDQTNEVVKDQEGEEEEGDEGEEETIVGGNNAGEKPIMDKELAALDSCCYETLDRQSGGKNCSGEQNNTGKLGPTLGNNNDNMLEHFDSGNVSSKHISKSIKQIKQELFCERDELVPWWQYIRSGVGSDSVHMLHPLHSGGEASGDVSLLHSFGFGYFQLRSSHSHDIAGVMESLRRQLEDTDHLQGVQCFVDGDSAFAGAACNVMGEFWEDAGQKIPAVFFTSFQPLPWEVMEAESKIDYADRRKDEASLNRLLATSHMTRHESSVYVPLELALWGDSFAKSMTEGSLKSAEWLQNDTATAQLIAMFADTALYGVRDDGCVAQGSANRPAFYMHHWLEAVRPTRNLRVAAALTALPLRVYNSALPRNDLWDFLQHNPLLQTCGRSGSAFGLFAPLTHPISFDSKREAGRVLGHAVTLRGAGKLLDLTYPRQEALLRYGLPLRTSNYIPLATENGYPISSTFPHDFVLPRELLVSGALTEIDVGSHVVSTYASAPMLQEIAVAAQKVLRCRLHRYEEAYEIEGDEWKEIIEEVLQIRDDYDHHEIETD